MMTITAGMMARLRPAAAAEFSFLLGCLTLSAACLYELAKDLSRAGQVGPSGAAHRTMFETLGWAPVAIGVLVAGVSAGAAVKWLVGVLNRHGLTPFAWYRLALAVMLAGLVLGGVVRG
jgi:undecaprenyl-diphosphatase